MLPALLRYPKHLRKSVASEWAKRSNAMQAISRAERGPDADTLRKRALYDARGKVEREGCDYSSAGEQNWQTIRSLNGRTDQYDLCCEGQVCATAGPRRLPAMFRP